MQLSLGLPKLDHCNHSKENGFPKSGPIVKHAFFSQPIVPEPGHDSIETLESVRGVQLNLSTPLEEGTFLLPYAAAAEQTIYKAVGLPRSTFPHSYAYKRNRD